MNQFNRKNFLRKIFLAGLGSALLPRMLSGHPLNLPVSAVAALPGPDTGHYVPNEFSIVDLHCHPSLKMYLWGRKLWRRHTPGLGINAVDLQDDMEQLSSGSIPEQAGQGFVKGIVVAHYLPEEAVTEQWDTVKKIYPWIVRLFRNFAGKLEHGDWTNFDQITQIIDRMEDQVMTAANKKGGVPFKVARSFQEFQDAISNNEFPIAHAIEGAHALGRNPYTPTDNGRKRKPQTGSIPQAGPDDADPYIKNLEKLKCRGVCMMTLAHLFRNDIAYCVEGISPDEKKSIGMKWNYTPDKNLELTPVGVKVVDWMLDNGMIVDLTHSTPAARDQVFRRNAGRAKPRPIVFTHTGAQKVFTKYSVKEYDNFAFYCVSAEEVARIVACDGTIGVIPEVFWLAGGDTHLKCQGLPPKLFRNGIPYMVETIQYINSLTPNKDYRHISIGTDFDGFSDEPQDLYEATQLDALIEALREALKKELGNEVIADRAVKRIMSGNALRVLENGWV
jgi:microsomal dipeptidase-like Zn-dependent dipeptidase